MFSYLLLSVRLVIAFCPTIIKGEMDLQSGEKEMVKHPKLKHGSIFNCFPILQH